MIRLIFTLLFASASIGLISAAPARAVPAVQLAIPSGVWQLQAIVDGDGNQTVPANPAAYTIEFIPGAPDAAPEGVEGLFGAPSGTVAVQLDCNSGSGEYALDGVQLSITNIASTLKLCPEPSLAPAYSAALETANFFTVEEGSFILFFAGGSLHFVPAGSSAPAEEAPAADTPVDEAPAENVPASDVPAEDAPAEDVPASDAPASDDAASDTGSDGTTATDETAAGDDASANGADGQVSGGAPAGETPATE